MRRLALFAIAAAACGGSNPQVSQPLPGQSHDTTTAPPSPPATAPDAGPGAPPRDAGAGAAVSDAGPAGPVTFELKNEGPGELNFGVTKGWGPVIFGYTGKPPKAKAVILFASSCTASCDAPPEEACPECKEPETKKEELAMARTETAAAGESVKVPWDGKIRVYEKATKARRCKCWRAVDPPADTYTVKACGLRPPSEPGKASRPVCAETKVDLGPGTLPATISLSFAK